MRMKLFEVSLLVKSDTTREKEEKIIMEHASSNMQVDLVFSAEPPLHHSHISVFSQAQMNLRLTPQPMVPLHLTEQPGLSCHAKMQAGNPYVSHTQHDRRGEGTRTFLSCSNPPEQFALWMSGRDKRDKRDIGFARC